MKRHLAKILKIIPILFLITTVSCRNKIERAIEGFWSIDTIYYLNYDARACFWTNMIIFKDDGIIELPEISGLCNTEVIKVTQENDEKWEVIKTSDSKPIILKIASRNKAFVGLHNIVFYKDRQNKLLKMKIQSDSLFIICRKGLLNYDLNIDLINELETLSKKNK